ncbi:MAG: hypothetical protein ACREOC_14630 [Gemmatimonadales bacterium]
MPIPWWAALYLCGYAAFGVAAARVHARGHHPKWYVAVDLAATGMLLTLAVAHWRPELVAPLGRAAAAVLVLVALWDGYSAWQEIANIGHDPQLTPAANERTKWAAVLTGAVLMAPAYGLALSGVVQAWRQAA